MAAAAVPRRIPRGYDKRIIKGQLEQKFLCSSCKYILKEPIQSFCGHRFCKQCIDHLIQFGGSDVVCPSCQEEEHENEYSNLDVNQTFPDNAIKREFSALRVECPNDGCGWNGTFKDYVEHEEKCEFKPMLCECGSEVRESKMDDHKRSECALRTVQCPHCCTSMVFKDLENHTPSCPAIPVTCQDCGKPNIPRNQMDAHTDLTTGDCSKPVQCPLDCGEMVDRTKLKDHKKEKADVHIDVLKNRVDAIQAQLGESRGSPGDTGANRYEVLEQKIKQLEEKVVHSRVSLNASQSSTQSQIAVAAYRPRDPDIAGRGEPSGGEGVRLEALELKVDTFENLVAVLNRQLERSLKQAAELEQQNRIDREMQNTYEAKIRNLERSMALKDVSLAEQDLRIQSLESTGYEGILVWKITDFSRRRQEAMNGRTTSIYSPSFYTSRTGYKMCARIYLNGDGMGKGTHISLFFVIMRGQYDALLRWPFRQKVTFFLMDQNSREHIVDAFRPDPSSSSFKRPVSDMNIASGCPLFVPHSTLDNSKHAYIKDNTIFIKIIVDTSDLN